MKKKKIGQNFYNVKTAVQIVLLVLLSVQPIFAEQIKLINSASFEPIKINPTANVNTTTSRAEENLHIPTSQIPIPQTVEKYFPQTNSTKTSTNTEIQPSSTSLAPPINDNIKGITNDWFTPVNESVTPNLLTKPQQQAQADPFNVINNTAIPTEYKKQKQSAPPSEQLPQYTPDGTPLKDIPSIFSMEEDTNFYATAEENIADTTDYTGKIISNVRVKGLSHISDKIPLQVISTKKDSVFNEAVIQKDLQKIYNIGYFTDNMFVEPELAEDGTVLLNFVLEENITVTQAKLSGNKTFTDTELSTLVKPLEGLPQNLNLINETIDKINKYYADNGYVLAKVTDVEDNADGKLVFQIAEGTIKEIKIEGNTKTKDYIIQRNILTQVGSIYNENIFKKDLAKIYDTQIFDEVNRKIEEDTAQKGQYIVTVIVKEGSSNNVGLSIGLDNALGGFGSVSYNEKNLFGKNQKLSLSGLLGTGLLLSDSSIKNRMNYQIELNFTEPHFFNDRTSLTSKLYYRDLGSYQVPLAVERRLGLNARIEHKVYGYDNLSTTLSTGAEYIHLSEGDFNKISSIYREAGLNVAKRHEQLVGGTFFNIAPGLKYSTLDDENMPRSGIIAKVNFLESFGLSDIKHTHGKLIGGITKYIPVAKKSTLAIGARAGIKVHGNDMPEVMAFRLGGPYSIRGFRMNGVGTGESFLMGSAELQTPIPFMDKFKYEILKNLRFAFFVDAGRVFDPTISSKLYDRPLSAISAGMGLRINIPKMGPISIDYGLPITNVGKYGSKSGYFTFGTGGLYDSY
ncbi:MAG: BamA/TamA family outer membrane protein [bacterium]|nr:BamA/TamA family outer membrane protein [bacterium]